MLLDPKEIEIYRVEEGVVIWYLGGPSVAIKTRETLIYLDLYTGPPPEPDLVKAIPEVIDPEAIRRADAALSTHHDPDHCHRPSLECLHRNTSALFMGPKSCCKLYREWGFDAKRVRQISPGESLQVGDITVHALSSKDVFDPDAVTYLLEAAGVKIFDSGDTLYFSEMAEIGRRWELEIALLSFAKNPEGEVYYMDEEQVLMAARDLGAKIVIPKHYDLWEQFTADPRPVIERLISQGHEARILGLGEKFALRGHP